MQVFRSLAVWGILLALMLASAGRATAQSSAPLKTIDVRIGPYPVTVSYYSEAQGGRPLIFSIAPREAQSSALTYEVTAIPGTTVNAVPVKAQLAPDPAHPGGVRGSVNLPVSGQWMLTVDITGPHGLGNADVPILAGAPPAIPEWLGWMIGLLPAWLLIGFVGWQSRRSAPAAGHAGTLAERAL